MATDFIGIDVEGIPELLSRLGRISDRKAYAEGVEEAAKHIRNKMMEYPPKKADSDYKRTGKLRRGWYIESFGQLRSLVLNEVPYAIYVQGEKRVWFHKLTGWKTTDEVIERQSDAVARIMARAAERAIRG